MPMAWRNPLSGEAAVWDLTLQSVHGLANTQFSHKGMSFSMADFNVMGGKGRTGRQGLASSAKAGDSSLNSTYNQAKMLSQCLRLVGLMVPAKPGCYSTTPLLDALMRVKNREKKFWELFIRSANNPCPHIMKVSPSQLRPLLTGLRMMTELGGAIHRDEFLVGILTILEDDKDPLQYQASLKKIEELRRIGTKANLNALVTEMREKLKHGDFSKTQKIKSNSIYRNWTRIPQAAGLNADITEQASDRMIGYKGRDGESTRKIRDDAKDKVKSILERVDIRARDTNEMPPDVQYAFLRAVHRNLLIEWGLETMHVDADIDVLKGHNKDLAQLVLDDAVLHHPFAEQSVETLVAAGLMDDPSTLPESPFNSEKYPELIEIPRLVLADLGRSKPITPTRKEQRPKLKGLEK